MARTVMVLCDVHLEEGKRVAAEELPPIEIEGNGPRVLALCREHKREYYDPFVDLVDDLARDLADESPRETGPEAQNEEPEQDGSERDDQESAVAESPAMSVVPDQPGTARWDCPMDDCDKSYSASGDTRAEELKRLGNLHLSTSHHLDKAAREEMLSA